MKTNLNKLASFSELLRNAVRVKEAGWKIPVAIGASLGATGLGIGHARKKAKGYQAGFRPDVQQQMGYNRPVRGF